MNTWERPRTRLRIAMGICPDCADRPAAPHGKRCSHCRDTQNRKKRMKYAKDRKNGIPRFSAEKYRKLADEKRLIRACRKASGLCIQCGSPSTRFIRCTLCRDKNANAKHRYRMRVKAKEINRVRGMAA